MISILALMPVAVVAAAPQVEEPAAQAPTLITLEEALQIALSENVAVKVADKEIERSEYAKKGTYASLFPKIDGMASYDNTIEKRTMSIRGMTMTVGTTNTMSAGFNASMPLVNAQLWKSLTISGEDVELAVEKARSSRLEMVTQVKQAFFGVLLAKQAYQVYKDVYENAIANLELTEKKYSVQKASDLELVRAQTAVANATPNVFDAESAIILSLWQLKAVMGVDLEENIDVAGALDDYAAAMYEENLIAADPSLEYNSTMRQLAIQADQLANTIKLRQYANLPTLSLGFSYTYNTMSDEYDFSSFDWTPYAYVGLTLSIPIFAGLQRSNSIKQVRVQSDELSLQAKNTERQLRISIRQFLNTMDTALKTYDAATKAAESAQKAYDITAASYEVGSSTMTDLNDAQLQLVQAKMSVCQAVYSFVIAKANLEQVLGHDFIDEDNQ